MIKKTEKYAFYYFFLPNEEFRLFFTWGNPKFNFFDLKTHSLAETALKYVKTTLFMIKKTEKYALYYFFCYLTKNFDFFLP